MGFPLAIRVQQKARLTANLLIPSMCIIHAVYITIFKSEFSEKTLSNPAQIQTDEKSISERYKTRQNTTLPHFCSARPYETHQSRFAFPPKNVYGKNVFPLKIKSKSA